VQSGGKGQGATFRVTFASASEPVPRSNLIKAQSQPSRGLRVLLVDDHEDTRKILLRLLSRKGHSVKDAPNMVAALALIAREEFDVVISDIGLPDGNGHELIEQAKLQCPKLRGIALSGFGMDDDLQRSEDAGFDIHLTKPIDIEALDQHLRTIAAES
jgi:two-component system CheB/CheR fusion protein